MCIYTYQAMPLKYRQESTRPRIQICGMLAKRVVTVFIMCVKSVPATSHARVLNHQVIIV